MKTPLVLLTLIAGSMLVSPAWAGTPSSPEVSDGSGDVADSVDIVSLWVTSTASEVIYNLKVRDLAVADPAFDNEGSWHNIYRVEFALSSTGATHYSEVQISAIESQAAAGQTTRHVVAPVGTNVGTQYSGGRVGAPGSTPAGTVVVDAANDLIVVKLTRDGNLAPGTVISGITVKTYQNGVPHEMDNIFTPILGGGRTLKDTAGPGRPYTL